MYRTTCRLSICLIHLHLNNGNLPELWKRRCCKDHTDLVVNIRWAEHSKSSPARELIIQHQLQPSGVQFVTDQDLLLSPGRRGGYVGNIPDFSLWSDHVVGDHLCVHWWQANPGAIIFSVRNTEAQPNTGQIQLVPWFFICMAVTLSKWINS